MRIVVAGAGAGKTSSMASEVLGRLGNVKDGKIIFVITYTNSARNRIREKIIELHGSIPRTLKVETIHAFLIREIIFPFHHLLYQQHFTKVSQISLPDHQGFKASKLKELAANKIIHVEKVTETAKWVVYKKTGDNQVVKVKRGKIVDALSRYLDSVFVDEAQDMDSHFLEIIKVLNEKEIRINLVGDPKQDLRGRNVFKQMIEEYSDMVEYRPENHRCPISHVRLANNYVPQEELQTPQTEENGELKYILECNIGDISTFIEGWDYTYIYNKNDRFITHTKDRIVASESLSYEIGQVIKRADLKDSEIDKCVYSISKNIISNIDRDNNFRIFRKLERLLSIELTRQDKGKLGASLDLNREAEHRRGILVNSIDSIKGLEGDNCLFILTTDLAEYLFGEKNSQNKMLNYLYVALTRSRKVLTFLITHEVVQKYGREDICGKFQQLNIHELEKI